MRYNTVGYRTTEQNKKSPLIRLSGKYLAKYGFSISDRFTVEIKTNKIILKKVV